MLMREEGFNNMEEINICIIKPNKDAYSETFIQTHISKLSGNKHVLYGGDFPLYDEQGRFLIPTKLGLLSYLFQKRILKRQHIAVRNKALGNYLLEKKIHVVLAEYGMVGAQVTQTCQSQGIPLIVHFHGMDAHRTALLAKYRDRYLRLFSYSSAIVAVSGTMSKQLIKLGAPAEKVHLIPYGVDYEYFQFARHAQELHFVSVGRLVEKKAPIATIQAFALLAKRYPQATLSIVGDGPLMRMAQDEVAKLQLTGQIHFLGVLKHTAIRDLLASAYAYVQHAVQAADGDMEGTPNTILEAAAMGLPIVSTRHAGIQEAVIDGKTGFLVDEHAVERMADRLIVLAESPQLADDMGKAGRAHILANYDVKKQIAKLDALIRETAKNL